MTREQAFARSFALAYGEKGIKLGDGAIKRLYRVTRFNSVTSEHAWNQLWRMTGWRV